VVTKVLVFRPGLGDGGADRVTLTILQHLDRTRFALTLVLVKVTGVLVEQIPADVPVVDLHARRLALAVVPLARAIRRLDPDVILSTSSGGNSIAVLARILARSRARLVLSERSALLRATSSRSRLAVELPLKRLTYRRADLVTAVSDGVARELVDRLRLPPGLVRTVGNPIVGPDAATVAAEPVAHPWFAAGMRVLLACGRLVPQKDYPTMLEALAHIRRSHDVRLAILGDGPLRASLESRVSAMNLGGVVAFLGFDPNPLKYMARAFVLLLSSRVEGLPGTLIQSLSVGTPVIATDCDFGPREVVRDGIDGWLVPVGDARAIADKTIELLDNPARRDELASAARSGASRFTIQLAMTRYESALLGEAA